jgi:hypothetical protein
VNNAVWSSTRKETKDKRRTNDNGGSDRVGRETTSSMTEVKRSMERCERIILEAKTRAAPCRSFNPRLRLYIAARAWDASCHRSLGPITGTLGTRNICPYTMA